MTDNEIRQLARTLPSIPEPKERTLQAWANFRQLIRFELLTGDYDQFMNWGVLRQTMVNSEASGHYEAELQGLKDMNPPWWPCPDVGDTCTPTRVHHAYWLAMFEKAVGPLKDYAEVVEFGGGYGDMAALVLDVWHHYGVTGKYTIYDFPELLLVQDLALRRVTMQSRAFARLVSKTEDIVAARPLIISTWGMSEAPEKDRKAFLARLPDASACLYTYSDGFGEMNNVKWFPDAVQESGLSLITGEISSQPGHHWLFGKSQQV